MPSDQSLTRRRALKIGAIAGVGGAAAAAYKLGPWARPLGANADVRIGVVGLRGKGGTHIGEFREIPGCRVAAVADVDTEFLDREKAAAEKAGSPLKTFRDARELLADKDVDAVVVATPNHWHGLMAQWALEAGKHIYVEKPLAHSLAEGEALVAAAAKSGLVAQTGTQRRSDMAYGEAKEWLAEGHLGAIERVRVIVYRNRKKLTKRKSPAQLPATLDYDTWCGPAAKETLYRSKVHYDWHWNWNTGDGELGNNGIHFIDTARWLLGDPPLPARALSIGGRLGWGEDAGQTPNTHLTWFDGDIPLLAEVRNLPMKPGMEAMDHASGVRMGTLVECEGGTLAWPVARDTDGKKLKKFDSDDGHGHGVNWLKAIVEGKPEMVHAPLEQGHLSTACCHLGNLSHRLGETTPPAQIDAELADGPAADLCAAMFEHLHVNGVDLEATLPTVGRLLETDGAELSGASAAEAKALDRREGRPGFELG